VAGLPSLGCNRHRETTANANHGKASTSTASMSVIQNAVERARMRRMLAPASTSRTGRAKGKNSRATSPGDAVDAPSWFRCALNKASQTAYWGASSRIRSLQLSAMANQLTPEARAANINAITRAGPNSLPSPDFRPRTCELSSLRSGPVTVLGAQPEASISHRQVFRAVHEFWGVRWYRVENEREL
jgi:hypothetical protein